MGKESGGGVSFFLLSFWVYMQSASFSFCGAQSFYFFGTFLIAYTLIGFFLSLNSYIQHSFSRTGSTGRCGM